MKKIISFVTLFSLVLSSLASLTVLPQISSAQNIGSLQSIVTPGFSFRKDLRFGDTDPDILQLQKVLNADVDTVVALSGPGSRGDETTYFGSATKAAVIKFQTKYSSVISSQDGLVNRPTRTKLNLLVGIMTTSDSVGLPQSRAGAGTTTSSPVVGTVTSVSYGNDGLVSTQNPSGRTLSVCQFVDLMASINVVTTSNANNARNTFACGASLGNAIPRVDIKVNGRNGPLSLDLPETVTVSWTATGVTSCVSGGGTSKPLVGSQELLISDPGIVDIFCLGPNGSINDAVFITDSNDTSDDGLILRVSPLVLSNSATLFISSNESASYKINYGATTATLLNVIIPGENTNSTYDLTNLQPSTTYYYKVSATSTSGDTNESPVQTFTTLAVSSNVVNQTDSSIPPSISFDYASPLATSAQIHILTNKAVSAKVFYGLTPGVTTITNTTNGIAPNVVSSYTYSATETLSTLNPVVTLTNLTASTTYHYMTVVTDSNNQTARTLDKVFTTVSGTAVNTVAANQNITAEQEAAEESVGSGDPEQAHIKPSSKGGLKIRYGTSIYDKYGSRLNGAYVMVTDNNGVSHRLNPYDDGFDRDVGTKWHLANEGTGSTGGMLDLNNFPSSVEAKMYDANGNLMQIDYFPNPNGDGWQGRLGGSFSGDEVQFGPVVVDGVASCYDEGVTRDFTNLSFVGDNYMFKEAYTVPKTPSGRYSLVTVSKCGSIPIPETLVNASPQTRFLYDSTGGSILPTVGQILVGIADNNTTSTQVASNLCRDTSNTTSNVYYPSILMLKNESGADSNACSVLDSATTTEEAQSVYFTTTSLHVGEYRFSRSGTISGEAGSADAWGTVKTPYGDLYGGGVFIPKKSTLKKINNGLKKLFH